MQKMSYGILLLSCIGIIVAGCGGRDGESGVESVAIAQQELQIAMENSATLTASVEALDGVSREVNWTSTLPSVVEIDRQSGEVKPIAPGTAMIMVSSVADPKKITSIKVVVVEKDSVDELSIVGGDIVAEIGEINIMEANIVVKGNISSDVDWRSSNPEIASVSEHGAVTAHKEGEVEISVHSIALPDVVAYANMRVLPPRVVSISIAQQGMKVPIGLPFILTARVTTVSGASRKIRWRGSDDTVALIDEETGVVTTVSPGSVVFEAVSVVDPSIVGATTIRVLSELEAQEVVISGEELELEVGDSHTYNSLGLARWFSSDQKVASINESTGEVIALGGGETTITAISPLDPSNKSSVVLRVAPPMVDSVRILMRSVKIALNSEVTYAAIVEVVSGADRSVTWESSNPSVAVIDPSSGKVVPISVGETMIAAKSSWDPTKRDTVILTIYQHPVVERVAILNDIVPLEIGDNYTFSADVTSLGGASSELLWGSSNENVAVVEPATGKATAVSAGKVEISATSVEFPSVLDTVEVAVLPPGVKAVTIDQKITRLALDEQATLTASVEVVSGASKKVVWRGSSPGILNVETETGTITPVSPGKVEVTAISVAATEKTDSITIEVYQHPVVEEVDIEDKDVTLEIGDRHTYPVDVITLGGASSDVLWKSSAPDVATINSRSGRIVAIGGGETTITATSEEGADKYDSVTLTVLPRTVNSVSIGEVPGSLSLKESILLIATVDVTSGASTKILWSSSSPEIAGIDPASGRVTPMSVGETTITAVSEESPEQSDSIVLTIYQHEAVDGVSILDEPVVLEIGEVYTYSADVVALGGASSDVIWRSSNIDVATVVPSTGEVVAKSGGTTEISAISADFDGEYDTAVLTVLSPEVNSVAIAEVDRRIAINGSLILAASVEVTSGASERVIWSSSDAGIASVNPKTGMVTPVSVGEVTITAASEEDPDKRDTMTLSIFQHSVVESVAIVGQPITLEIGEDRTYSVDVVALGGASSSVRWRSSNPRVASVDPRSGRIVALTGGKSLISAESIDFADVGDTLEITVLPPQVDSVSIDQGDSRLSLNESITLTATVEVKSGASSQVSWKSADRGIAIVDSITGKVTPVAAGQVEITAISKGDSEQTDSLTLSIYQHPVVVGVVIPGDPVVLEIGEAHTYSAEVEALGGASREVTWESSNARVATVDASSGVVTAVGGGSASITAVSVDSPDKYASSVISVLRPKVNSISVDQADQALWLGDNLTLSATVTVTSSASQKVTWVSNNTSVSEVEPDSGKVIPLSTGAVTVTAISEADPSKVDSIVLTIFNKLKETVVLEPAGDAYVADGGYSDENSGSSDRLKLGISSEGVKNEVYMKFDLMDYKEHLFSEVALRVFVHSGGESRPTNRTIGVYSVVEAWDEHKITWHSANGGEKLIQEAEFSGDDGWVTLDVTNYINSLASDRRLLISLLLVDDSLEGKGYFELSSREDRTNSPQLRLK